MIQTDTVHAEKHISRDLLEQSISKAHECLEDVRKGRGEGSEWLGWRRILKDPDSGELKRIARTGSRIRKSADIFIVCGIGGSYLGSKAVIEALRPPFDTDGPEIIFAGHHIGGQYLEQLVKYLEVPKSDGSPKNIWLNVISKSGSTLETALSFRVISDWMYRFYGDEASERIVATTGPEGGVLNTIIKKKGLEKFVIPNDVGGRYSVLTPAGLLPVAVAGIRIEELFEGAVSACESFEKTADDLLRYAALRYLFHEKGTAVDVISSFEPELHALTGWIQQLLGESEGKKGKGLFPAPAAYSTDLHSIGQLVQQGRRNLMETFLTVKNTVTDFAVPVDSSGSDGLDYISGKQFHDINSKALEGTVEAHSRGGVPVIKIILDELNARTLGELIYYFELFTAVYTYMLGVNPFDQPGVEYYKQEMYRKLGKT